MLPLSPQKHQISKSDLEELLTIGVIFNGISEQQIGQLNAEFANFDLRTWIMTVRDLLSKCYTNNLNIEVNLEETPTRLTVAFYSDDYGDSNTGLALSRKFTFDGQDIVVLHDFFRLPIYCRRRGIATQVLKVSAQQYVNMGATRIKVHAALSDGGFVWALADFRALNKYEMVVILERAKVLLQPSQYQYVERIFTNYYSKNPNGQNFPIFRWANLDYMQNILQGSSWHGEIDLTDTEQFSKFIKYVTS